MHRLRRGGLAVGVALAVSAPAVSAQKGAIDDIVAACGGFRMVVAAQSPMTLAETEAVAAILRERLGYRGGISSALHDAVRVVDEGRFEVVRAGVRDLGQLVEAFLARGAGVDVHLLIGFQTVPEATGDDVIVLPGRAPDDRFYIVDAEPLVANVGIANARMTLDEIGPVVSIELTDAGRDDIDRVDWPDVGEELAVVVDGTVLISLYINVPIAHDGGFEITGLFTVEEAADLAASLSAGAMTEELLVIAETQIGPRGGNDGVCAAIGVQ